ncbi:MAG: glycoside hydrolase family 31 protein, partial [Pusillimonas sp.]|nr:glycoside hydrolase family 31 protein [Pusillimonas sp.]
MLSRFLHAKSTTVDFELEGTERVFRIEAHAPGVFRMRCGPAAAMNPDKLTSRARQHAEMLLVRQEPVSELSVSSLMPEEGDGWRIEQGDMVLDIMRSPMSWSLYKGDDYLLGTAGEAGLRVHDANDGPRWEVCLEIEDDEVLCGLGETSGPLDRRGERIVSDQVAARALPLLWSPTGWGVYVNSLGRATYDLGATVSTECQISIEDRGFDVFLFVGDPAEILNQYTALTGRAGQPGLWPMGVWLDQAPGQATESLHSLAQSLRSAGFSFDVVRLTGAAAYAFQDDKPAFEWDAQRATDARSLSSLFESVNVQLVAPTFPGVFTETVLFEEWEDRGWLLINDDDGSAHVFPGDELSGGRPYGLLDLTNKDVYKLWSERQRQMFDEGIAAPMCNAQYAIPDGITARGAESGAVLRVVYPALARNALFDAFAGHKTPQEGIVLSNDLFPAVQRYAWQMGPNVSNDWAGLTQSLRTALSLGASAVTVQMHTLGNASRSVRDMTPELYVRWLSCLVFSGNFSFQAVPSLLPGAFDAATQTLVQHWLQWRYRLIPYALGIIEDAVRTGLPVQRSMLLAFPDDPAAHSWDTQFMFGPALLIAPLTQPGRKARIYLPEGSGWWDLNTGWRYEGGTVLEMEVGLDTLPVFGREGHMLCLGPYAPHTAEFNSARLLDEVWLFGMPEHSPAAMRNKIRVMQMQGSSYI